MFVGCVGPAGPELEPVCCKRFDRYEAQGTKRVLRPDEPVLGILEDVSI